MNKNIQNQKINIAATCIQSKIILQFKHFVCFILSFSFMLFGVFSSITAQAAPVTDSFLTSDSWDCTRLANAQNIFNCRLSIFGSGLTFPSDFKLGVGTTPGGTCTFDTNFATCANIPVTTNLGINTLNYVGTGLIGGSTTNIINVVPRLTIAQDQAAVKTCPATRANLANGVCTFVIPANTALPDHYRLGVEGASNSTQCNLFSYPVVTCNNISTGSLTGPRNIESNVIDNGVPIFAGGVINIAPYMTAIQESQINNFVCNYVLIGEVTTCYGSIPLNYSLPTNYKIGVGVNPDSTVTCDDQLSTATFICYNVPTSLIPGPNVVRSNLNPTGNGLSSNLFRYFDAVEDLNIPKTCLIANTNDSTTCLIQSIPQFRRMMPGYKLGVGTSPNNSCVEQYDYSSPRAYCNNVPTGNMVGTNIRINSNLNLAGSGAISELNNVPCLDVADYISDQSTNLNILNIFTPIKATAAGPNCCPTNSTPLCGLSMNTSGGTLSIFNQSPDIPAVSNQSEPLQQKLTIPTETATTRLYDPLKLKNQKKQPSRGVLSESDDRSSIADPYECGGDIHGDVEYSGDYNNLRVKILLLNKSNSKTIELPAIIDNVSHLYVAKIDYNKIPEANYLVQYSVESKISNRVLDKGEYTFFITNKCNVLKSKAIDKTDNNITLARTGGASESSVLVRLIIFLILASFLTVKTYE